MIRLIFIVAIICSSMNVFGQDYRNKAIKNMKHWSKWKTDSTYNDSSIVIIKERNRYLHKEHGHEYEKIILTYDNCNKLIHKRKEYRTAKCFSGTDEIIYDREYKSNCTK